VSTATANCWLSQFWKFTSCSRTDIMRYIKNILANLLIDKHLGSSHYGPDALRPYFNGPFMPYNLISVQESPVPLLQFQMVPRLKLLKSSASTWKEPSCTCLNEAKASHSHRMWAEVSSSAPHILHNRLLVSPIKWRCLLRVLCPARRPIMTLDCVLLKDKSLVFALGLGPK